MSQLLEILGRAITVNTPDLIWHWVNTAKPAKSYSDAAQHPSLNQIIQLMNNGKTIAAQELLHLYLLENPACTYGRMAFAAIFLQNNQLPQAIEQLDSVYRRQPNNTMALYALGHCYERLDRESEAIEFYQDCLKFKNYLQLPAQRLAAIYLKNGQLEKAIHQYELLKDEYPDDISTLVSLGYLYIAAAEFTEAIKTFDNAILIHPDNFHTQDDYIDQLIASGQLHEALHYITVSLDKQPAQADMLTKHADVLSKLGAIEEAISQYQQAIYLCPDFLEATIKLGTQYLQLHQDKLAARQFNKAVEINDKIVDAYIGLATAQKLSGNVSDALTTLSLAAAIQPNSSLLFAETATLCFKSDLWANWPFSKLPSSTNLIDTLVRTHWLLIRHQPQNPDLHYRLGLLLMNSKRPNEAIKSFQTALQINPVYHRANHKLAVCLFEVGQQDLALEQLTAPVFFDSKTLQLHYKVALLYCNKVKFTSSLLNLERYLDSNFAGTHAASNISIVLQNLGLLDRVEVMWENLSDMATQVMNADIPFSQD